MKLIAITQRCFTEAGPLQGHDMLDPRLSQLLLACDLLPLILPTSLDVTKALFEHYQPSGILLSGGNNTPSRTALETWLIDYAMEHRLPLLGICHGMQAIQRYHGIHPIKVSGHVAAHQTIAINERDHTVNTYHDEGTTETNDTLHVWATHQDGTIKAIKDKQHAIYGIMWHPERQTNFYPPDLAFIKALYAGNNACEQSY
jgi:gamma-glutamyl-gamma-aminobutyrate hydrolase PuuD